MSTVFETPTQRRRQLLRHLRPTGIALLAAAALVACGGGGGSDPSNGQQGTGVLSVRLTDGPKTDASHVWITVTQVSVHASDEANVDTGGWVSMKLAAPVTLDMNALSNGDLSAVIGQVALPVGTYRQIRLTLAASDAALTDSAVAAGLVYNDQVDYTGEDGAPASAPLEIAQAKQGIALLGNFEVKDGESLNLAIEFDVGNDVVPFRSEHFTAFTMDPDLKYFDLAKSGAVIGKVDTSACAALGTNPCANLMAKAEAPSADGTYRSVKRWTSVAADGTFVLYPLSTTTASSYDVVVRGDYTQSMVVRNVPITAGSMPESGATSVSTNPLAAQTAGSFAVNWSAAVQPTGVTGRFYQTLGADTLPYEFSTQRLDPFSGKFMTDLQLTNGAVMVGDYVAAGDPAFNAVTPLEGAGAYLAMTTAQNLARTSAGTVAATGDGTTTLITPPDIGVGKNVATLGTVSGTIHQTTAGKFDSGFLVVTRGGSIVNTTDVGAVLQAGGGAGGNYSIGHLPAGSAAMTLGQNGNGSGIYFAYLRVWNSATPDDVVVVPVNGSADLNATDTATLNVTVP